MCGGGVLTCWVHLAAEDTDVFIECVGACHDKRAAEEGRGE